MQMRIASQVPQDKVFELACLLFGHHKRRLVHNFDGHVVCADTGSNHFVSVSGTFSLGPLLSPLGKPFCQHFARHRFALQNRKTWSRDGIKRQKKYCSLQPKSLVCWTGRKRIDQSHGAGLHSAVKSCWSKARLCALEPVHLFEQEKVPVSSPQCVFQPIIVETPFCHRTEHTRFT